MNSKRARTIVVMSLGLMLALTVQPLLQPLHFVLAHDQVHLRVGDTPGDAQIVESTDSHACGASHVPETQPAKPQPADAYDVSGDTHLHESCHACEILAATSRTKALIESAGWKTAPSLLVASHRDQVLTDSIYAFVPSGRAPPVVG